MRNYKKNIQGKSLVFPMRGAFREILVKVKDWIRFQLGQSALWTRWFYVTAKSRPQYPSKQQGPYCMVGQEEGMCSHGVKWCSDRARQRKLKPFDVHNKGWKSNEDLLGL